MNRALHQLADKVGILDSYIDQGGTRRHTSDAARIALLAALGLDAATPEEATVSLAVQSAPPCRVLEACQLVADDAPVRLHARLPDEFHRNTTWKVTLRRESGAEQEWEGKTFRTHHLRVPLPQGLPQGYHRVRLSLHAAGHHHEVEQTLIVTPSRCVTPAEILGAPESSAVGIWGNLYTLNSGRNFGIGDITDLRHLTAWAARCGAAFVGVNPLHVLRNRGGDISPYSPVSRLFRNPIYLDVTQIPELNETPAAQALLSAPSTVAALAELRHATHVDYARIFDLKLAIVRLLHDSFLAHHCNTDNVRGRAYARYVGSQGQALRDVATFCALEDHFAAHGLARAWQAWPAAYHDVRGAAVQGFVADNERAIAFHCYLQFELDRQLDDVAIQARAAGMPIGLYQDLAIGSAPNGADAWAFRELFVEGVSIGAPPDDYSERGQDWGLPPLNPQKLAADGFRYWRLLLQSAFAHAGAVRLDHIMGLFRLYWIPRGQDARLGAYVRYPAEPLLAILALESQRHNALVIGEDLGTVPEEVPEVLARWGVLSSRVMYFEKNGRGKFLPAEKYSDRALVTATTHDHAPLAGYFSGRDLQLRHQIGHLTDDAAAVALAARTKEGVALRERLHEDNCLARVDETEPMILAQAVHHFLRQTPAPLVGLSLDDLVGETEPVNLPGIGPEDYPSWSRRMRMSLEELSDSRTVRRAFGDMPPEVRSPTTEGNSDATAMSAAY